MRLKTSLILVYIAALCLSGCNKKTEPAAGVQDRIVFGFSQLGDESEWRTSSSNDIKRAAEGAGVRLIFENAQQKQFNQIKAIRSFILNRVDIIAFSPIVEEGWDNILLEAKAAGIPVILVDRYIKTEEEGLYRAFIGSDFEREGYDAGLWLKKKFRRERGPIRIVEISGTVNSSPAIGRTEGILRAFEDKSQAGGAKFQIVMSVSGDFMRSKGKECMENILKEVSDFDVLYAHNDDMALGAIEVLEEHGIVPGKDVVIVSVDAQRSGLAALKEGKINCLVQCSPYVGDQLMDLAVNITGGKTVPLITYTEERIFTEDDDFETLPVRP